MVRLFAALPVPFEIAQGLVRRQDGLPGAKWRPTGAFHITLHFFGEVAEPVAADLDEALSAIRMSPFEVALEGAGAFGEHDHMRAVWAGVTLSDPLARLAAKCEAAAKRVGLKAERRVYRPHVTLAYLKDSAEPRIVAWITAHSLLKSPPWTARSFGLYSSWSNPDSDPHSGSGGSRYDLEREYPFP